MRPTPPGRVRRTSFDHFEEEWMVFLLCLIQSFLLSVKFISSNAGQVNNEGSNFINTIGGVVDCNTRVGREEKIAMDIAVQDVYSSTGHNLTTHIQDLSGKSDRAVSSAFHLSQKPKIASNCWFIDLATSCISF
ncbi:hypothetical protein OIU84_029914 [Salix udensis]|uniref:Uncharacterized protein n=1 Tax=Salix udensis TaxID=889485 RepID=A0AAD6KCQ9_9ROSI|nr:hypothetical protein OIU84_029914 [Salix udensis]